MKKYLLAGGTLLALAWGASAIGTENEVESALGISPQDTARLKWAVGNHQHLGRDATAAEGIAELKSRINEFVRREEAKVGGDTLGQWGGI